MTRTPLLLTTNPGLEDVAGAELADRWAAAGGDPAAVSWRDSGIGGRVRADVAAAEDGVLPVVLSLRSIHHALRHIETFELPDQGGLDAIRARVAAQDWAALGATTPFRVTSTRHGSHDFTSQQVQVVAGAAIQAATGAPVDLKGYRVNIQVDVIGTRAVIARYWTDQPLGLRCERAFNRRVALKPPVAYAMLRLATAGTTPARLLDPFCGTGTILLEAGSVLDATELHGGDIAAECVAGARENLERAGLSGRARVVQANARRLAEHYPAAAFDVVVTNPPWGRRLGKGVHFVAFYRDLLAGAHAVVAPGGRLAILAARRGAFKTALRRTGGWRVVHARIVDMSHVRAGLFLLEPAGGRG